METIIFFKQLGLTSLFVALLLGGFYWIRVALKKFFPNLKFWFKYKLLRRKFNEDVARYMEDDLKNGINAEEMFKTILLNGKATQNQAGEIRYIYKELQGRYDDE